MYKTEKENPDFSGNALSISGGKKKNQSAI